MWKIFITYSDKSKCVLTGKHNDIPLDLAEKYFNNYVADHICSARYQQYPKNKHPEMDLLEKIEVLKEFDER